MITIDEVRVGDAPEAWRAIGFDVIDDVCSAGSVRLRFGSDGTGITGWTLRGIPDGTTDIDGVPTLPSTHAASESGTHANGVTRIDHVVLMTPDLPRTTAALQAIGFEVRRERDAGGFTQVFFRLGAEILELVGPKEAGPGPAHLWGLTFSVADIDATAAFLGDRIGRVKDAVQPGRRISTLRGREIGVSPAVAFISEAVPTKPA